ncbi:hypothetical protein ONZ45_g12005 [Pleurotus djamor]|nr:hypothetical protein ONZ45_g12005 [Pleurotus djamor]
MVFYPDNVPRRDRALQLQNDITMLQNSAREAKAAMDKEDARMVPYINQILKNHNMATFDELQKKLEDALTDEQKAQYKSMLDNAQKLTSKDDVALMAMSGILFTSGIVAKGTIDIGNFLRAVNVVTVVRSYARAFITLVTEGVEAGARAFRVVATAFRWAEGMQYINIYILNFWFTYAILATTLSETLLETSTLARYASNAGRFLKVLSIIGIFADGFILAFDFFEQKKQRDELDKAIRELYVSRIIAKVYAQMCDAVKTQDGLMLGYLILVGDDGTISPDDQRAADKIAGKFVDFVKADWSSINTSSALDLLVVLDKQRDSWVTDDPTYQDAINDANNQMKQDPPAAPGTDTPVASAHIVVKTMIHNIAVANDEFYPPPTYDMAVAVNHLVDLKHEQLRLAH